MSHPGVISSSFPLPHVSQTLHRETDELHHSSCSTSCNHIICCPGLRIWYKDISHLAHVTDRIVLLRPYVPQRSSKELHQDLQKSYFRWGLKRTEPIIVVTFSIHCTACDVDKLCVWFMLFHHTTNICYACQLESSVIWILFQSFDKCIVQFLGSLAS